MNFQSEETRNRMLEAAQRGNETMKKQQQEIVDKYYLNPKLCKNCGNPLEYKKRKNDYCSRSCATSKNNVLGNIGRERKNKVCPNCGKKIPKNKSANEYCSRKCFTEYKKNNHFEEMMELYNQGLLGDNLARDFFRKITEKKCSICGLTEWMGEPVPLIVDHIDGDSDNNIPSNFRFVCCNCEALLPTSKGKNRGNGRILKKKRRMAMINN